MANVAKKKRVLMELFFREDGVYMVVENPHTDKPISIVDVHRVLNENSIFDADANAINTLLKSTEERTEVLLTTDIWVEACDEFLVVEITPDHMQVRVRFLKPRFGGKILTVEEIKAEIRNAGAVFGIRNDVIEMLVKHKSYSKTYIVGMGKEAKDGVDGRINYYFDTSPASHKPKLSADGTADFHNLDFFQVASQGQVLCEIFPLEEGEEGMTVLGEPIPYNQAKKSVVLPKGKNVTIDENGKMTADIDGQIVYSMGKTSILPMLEIPGDVGPETGNIDFNGSVNIRGSILTGFRVLTSGNLNVDGVIEGAYVQCAGNLNCVRGIQGSEKAEIIVQGDILTNYIRNCKQVVANGNVITNVLMHSNLKCYGSVDISSGKGMLAGGKTEVLEVITLKSLGSRMGTATTIAVGTMEETIETYNSYLNDIQENKTELGTISEAIQEIIVSGSRIPLSPAKQELLKKQEQKAEVLLGEIRNLQALIDEMLPEMQRNTSYAKIYEVVYPGVRLRIGNANIIVQDDIRHARLYNDKGRVAIGTI